MLPRIAALVGLIDLAIPAAGDASSHAVQRTEEYIAGFAGDTDGLCAEQNPAEVNVGAVCLSVVNRATVSLRIDDASLLPVAGYYVFTNASGGAIGSAISFCGQTTRSTPVPSGAAQLVVYIGGPALGPLACLVDTDGGWIGVGTAGTVTATYAG